MGGDLKERVELDKVLYVTGYKGAYQIRQSIVCLLSSLSCAFPILSIVFIGYVPKHRCAALPNVTFLHDFDINPDHVVDVKSGECSLGITTNVSGRTSYVELPCVNGFQYDVARDTSIVSEWDLVCDRAGLAELSQTFLMLGQGIGACVFTSLADRYGRKPVNMVCQLILVVASFGLAFINNIGGFTALRFIIGACQQGLGLTAYSIFVELCTTKMRTLAGCTGGLGWTFSCMLLAPLAHFMQYYSWRYFQLATLAGLIYGIVIYWILDESLRWLVANNKVVRAEETIKKICKANKTDFDKARAVLHEQILECKQAARKNKLQQQLELAPITEKNEQENLLEKNGSPPADETNMAEPEKYTILDILKHRDILKVTSILGFIWAVNSLTYYGLFLTSSSMSGNRFVNYFLNALVELPAMFVVFFGLKRIGRRNLSVLLHALSGSALIISVTLVATVGTTSAGSIGSVIFSLVGKFAVTASFTCLFILTPELFPTNMRNAGIGVASAVARVGGMLSPYSNTLSQLVIWGPGVVFGSCCVLASVLFLLLPETRGRELPTTIAEMREWSKQKRHVSEICLEIKQ
ncbi:organic cation transporter protein isoform X3 [Patella vulgata]|uniref:organic cation transporter protein isoform X3 n=1 Tax=Patella vulgata TaxID=6465 RepID=UPI002180137F|nr:organic cation transporter protein isoform X3 [Patella vulgata]